MSAVQMSVRRTCDLINLYTEKDALLNRPNFNRILGLLDSTVVSNVNFIILIFQLIETRI